MPAKSPMYLKPGKNGIGKNSKKLRELLSADMISPPLDDFRHMAHIGRGGDSDRFGDISFMKNPPPHEHGAFKRAASWGKKKRTTSSTVESATLDRKPKKRMDGQDITSSRTGLESPILKNAVSLPSLNKQPNSTSSTPPESPKDSHHNNNTISNGKVMTEERLNPKKAEEQYTAQCTPSSANGALDGPPKPRRIMTETTEQPTSIDKNKLSPLRRSSEVLSVKPQAEDDDSWDLNLDLGPSLLDDVLGIMDKISV